MLQLDDHEYGIVLLLQKHGCSSARDRATLRTVTWGRGVPCAHAAYLFYHGDYYHLMVPGITLCYLGVIKKRNRVLERISSISSLL